MVVNQQQLHQQQRLLRGTKYASALFFFFFFFLSLFYILPILVLFRHKFLYDIIFIPADNYYTGGACDIGQNANTAAFWGQLAFDYNNYYAPADNGYFLYVH